MSKEKELLEVIAKLRNCIKPMIGHPENPFNEVHLKEMVDLADEHIDTGKVFYAVADIEGEYFATGFNETDPEEVRKGILSLNEPQMEEEDFDRIKDMSLEDLCTQLGYTLDKDTQPF